MKILFLDFDGVLFDTLREVYLVNRFEFNKKSLFDPIEKDLYETYSNYKFLVYNIWMFYYYNPLIFKKEENIVEKFNAAIKKRDLEAEKVFCDNFLKIRHKLVLDNYEFWKSLEKPYDFFFEIKNLYEKEAINIAIVSKKNKTSILERFNSYGFNLDKNLVFAREALDKYSSKEEFMVKYMDEHGYKKALFVDDNNNNLKINNPNIKPLLALWGNNEPNSKGFSQKEAVSEIKKFFLI